MRGLFIGLVDLAAQLRCTPARALDLAEQGVLPAPVTVVAAQPFWDARQVMVWRGRQLRGHRVGVIELRMVAMGLRAEPADRIARRCGTRTDRVQPRQLAAAADLVEALDPVMVHRWRTARHAGARQVDLARADGHGASTLRLALDGLPDPPPPARAPLDLEAISAAWGAGQSWAQIAADAGTNRRRLVALVRRDQGGLFPPRYDRLRAAAYLGWSYKNVHGRHRAGTMPAPDGDDGIHPWCWQTTLDTITGDDRYQPCPVCGARFLRLKQHQRTHR